MTQWLIAFISVILLFVIFGAMLAISKYLAPKEYYPEKFDLYECGYPMISELGHFNIRFYIIAIMFTLFDIEAVFMYPWAVDFKGLGILGVIEMGLFVVMVFVGWIYAYKKGALEWE
ncbi:NADH-quinone oxidoreductase subunit A [Hippea maritima]|uniref:NADH-quinone oxidoreductase subunit n=1 Tax=Hippea maritima (strain ATCC 700847 / DSM 10411 / MH2) TaxID=760142 RepID=F2LXM3_HIPMA|nr:NADH-quinone oxidoreductase subunit A [Hippea maritima]AEA33209.1 NADH-ubiquinone/plastoquinone oxidoreductase chain 3 [Hippea maritima DSM 10411]